MWTKRLLRRICTFNAGERIDFGGFKSKRKSKGLKSEDIEDNEFELHLGLADLCATGSWLFAFSGI
jgi:hypothetical protein